MPGLTYSRFRFNANGNVSFIGLGWEGEVEDHEVSIESLDEAPRVTKVWVRGSNWADTFLTHLQSLGVGDADHGYAVPVGSADQLKPLPWFNIDQVSIQFDETVNRLEKAR